MSGLIPLALFLLACAMCYIGAAQTALSTLMRLPLRLSAERGERPERVGSLGYYLDDPLRMFLPACLMQALVVTLFTVLLLVRFGPPTALTLAASVGAVALVVVLCSHVVPLLLVRRDPERALEVLLPSFRVVARLLAPVTGPLLALMISAGRDRSEPAARAGSPDGGDTGADAPGGLETRDERQLLHSVVEFGDTLVREVMTPRPDIVAVRSTTTLAALRAVFEEKKYSRVPVYRDSLDDVLGFVFVKDLVTVNGQPDDRVIDQLLRPAHVVPESKRVAELLKEFQKKQVQSAIVHDEYGGYGGSCHDRGPARGDRGRDPRRVRRGVRTDRG